MKEEFLLGRTYKNIEQIKRLAIKAIDIYNNFRPHWSNGLLTPNDMHLQNVQPVRTWKNKKII